MQVDKQNIKTQSLDLSLSDFSFLSLNEMMVFSVLKFIYDSKNVTSKSHNIKKSLKFKNPQSRNDISSLM